MMGMIIGTDAYFFGCLPPIVEVCQAFGIDGINAGMTMLIGKNISLMLSPLVPATFLALGLLDNMDLGRHSKFSFKYLHVVSLLMIVSAIVLGVVTLN